jgi:hypothetical protein
MISLDIENKIVDYIKTSPLGVTSNEIANYVGLNRMTITKYLAIIREKALIDFKPFGMAKVWYIPVNMSKESFLSRLSSNLIRNMPENELKTLSERVGVKMGEEINQMYLTFYNTNKFSFDRVLDAYIDIGKKLGGTFKTILGNEKVSVEILKSPFEQESAKAMNKILSIIFAKIASINLGYARAAVMEQEGKNTMIDIYLKKEEAA